MHPHHSPQSAMLPHSLMMFSAPSQPPHLPQNVLNLHSSLTSVNTNNNNNNNNDDVNPNSNLNEAARRLKREQRSNVRSRLRKLREQEERITGNEVQILNRSTFVFPSVSIIDGSGAVNPMTQHVISNEGMLVSQLGHGVGHGLPAYHHQPQHVLIHGHHPAHPYGLTHSHHQPRDLESMHDIRSSQTQSSMLQLTSNEGQWFTRSQTEKVTENVFVFPPPTPINDNNASNVSGNSRRMNPDHSYYGAITPHSTLISFSAPRRWTAKSSVNSPFTLPLDLEARVLAASLCLPPPTAVTPNVMVIPASVPISALFLNRLTVAVKEWLTDTKMSELSLSRGMLPGFVSSFYGMSGYEWDRDRERAAVNEQPLHLLTDQLITRIQWLLDNSHRDINHIIASSVASISALSNPDANRQSGGGERSILCASTQLRSALLRAQTIMDGLSMVNELRPTKRYKAGQLAPTINI